MYETCNIQINTLATYIKKTHMKSIPNNKEIKFQTLFFRPFIFLARLPLTTEQWRVSFVRTYIYNPCSYELE
jgi:hypothetical protein